MFISLDNISIGGNSKPWLFAENCKHCQISRPRCPMPSSTSYQ